MAEESSEEMGKSVTCSSLLNGLKTTVEGLLANQSINVWNIYGGLNRVCKCVEDILLHRIKPQGEEPEHIEVSYWEFIQELKWLNPTLGPKIEMISRSNGSKQDKCLHWLRDCLHDHTLSSQLFTLVSNKQHLHQHYHKDGFLCNEDYFQAMLICLKSVEFNQVALLADISPNLLNNFPKKKTHIRSASLPTNNLKGHSINKLDDQDNAMLDHASLMALAPPFASPPKPSIFNVSMTGERALPVVLTLSSSPEENRETAKLALRNVLRRSGGESPTEHSNDFSFYDKRNSDPLLNIEFPPTPKHTDDSVFSFDKNYNQTLTSKQPVRKCLSEDIRSRANSQELADSSLTQSILDNEKLLTETEKNVNNNSGKSVPGKNTHKRSRSDISGISSNSHSNQSLVDNSDQEAQSDSTLAETTSSNSNDVYDTGWNRVDGVLQPPTQGQSLMSYLSSQDFHTCANLDKENAHFSISEALIAAIEQMKWNHVIRPSKDSDIEEESDEEIQQLRQRIRIRRRERLSEKARGFPAYSDGRTDTTPSASTSPFSSPYECSSQSDSSDSSEEIDDEEIELDLHGENRSNLTSLSNSGLSLSMASLYSDADLYRSNSSNERSTLNQEGSYVSAESVAISLIKKFSEKKLPKASDLEWLVSEKDAPQALLPLPKSYPVSPDDGENSDLLKSNIQTRLRGNLEWAPPRAQIIFNIHPTPKRNVILAKQNYRCAGCGMKVEIDYIKRFRYCEYLGKYFCQCCHSNQLQYIPGRIIRKWDFTKYPVSNFARDVLTRIYKDPLFNISDINPSIYRKSKTLETIRDLRKQLYHLQSFLKVCKTGISHLQDIERLPRHWSEDCYIYSLQDLLNVKNGSMLNQLKNIVSTSLSHVDNCQFCQGMGFICEMCHANDVIFPFQLNKITTCSDCHSCYHKECFVPDKCSKCARIEARRIRLLESPIEDDESSEEIVTVAQTH